MIASVFPQRYSHFRRRKYVVEFRRNGQQVTHLWDPRKPFALGAPARFYLKKENSRIRLLDRKDGGHGVEVASVKFNEPLTVKLHPADAEPWVITLRAVAPYEPVAFRSPETLDISDVAPPFYLYAGLRRRLLSQTQVGEHFKIRIAATAVFSYEYLQGQHTIIPLQEDVTWRNFDGECQEMIKDVPFSLDNHPFLEGWVEWEEHWWRCVPLHSPEHTEIFLVHNQDPSFITRNTTIAISLVAWVIWLLVPMRVTEIAPSPAKVASVSIQAPRTFVFPNPPESNTALAMTKKIQKRMDEVTVKITSAAVENEDENGDTVVGTSDGQDVRLPSSDAEDTRSGSRRSFKFGEEIILSGKGSVASAAISKTLTRRGSDFQECYNVMARKTPEARGTVILNWTITRLGKAEAVSIPRTEIKDSGFMDCLKTLIESMDFPRSKRDSVTVEMPFLIQSTGH